MERTRAIAARTRSGHIQLNGAELDKILKDLGHASLRGQARFLNVGVATLHSAYKGSPVGERFIYRCRTTLPKVTYEHLFREVPKP